METEKVENVLVSRRAVLIGSLVLLLNLIKGCKNTANYGHRLRVRSRASIIWSPRTVSNWSRLLQRLHSFPWVSLVGGSGAPSSKWTAALLDMKMKVKEELRAYIRRCESPQRTIFQSSSPSHHHHSPPVLLVSSCQTGWSGIQWNREQPSAQLYFSWSRAAPALFPCLNWPNPICARGLLTFITRCISEISQTLRLGFISVFLEHINSVGENRAVSFKLSWAEVWRSCASTRRLVKSSLKYCIESKVVHWKLDVHMVCTGEKMGILPEFKNSTRSEGQTCQFRLKVWTVSNILSPSQAVCLFFFFFSV